MVQITQDENGKTVYRNDCPLTETDTPSHTMTPAELAAKLDGVEAGNLRLSRSRNPSCPGLVRIGRSNGEYLYLPTTDLYALALAVCRAAGDRVVEAGAPSSQKEPKRVKRVMAFWQKMTPEEYANRYQSFGPHRAEIECEIVNEAKSAAVSVFLLPFVDTDVVAVEPCAPDHRMHDAGEQL